LAIESASGKRTAGPRRLRARLGVLAALAAFAAAPTGAQPSGPEPTQEVAQKNTLPLDPANAAYQDAIAALRAGPSAADDARKKLDEIIDSPLFAQLNAAQQHYVLGSASGLALRADKDLTRAHGLAVRATGMRESVSQDWLYRAYTAWRVGDAADAASSLTWAAQRWPKDIAAMNERVILPIARAAPTKDARYLLEALFAANWQTRFGDDASVAWGELARLYLEAGNVPAAVRVSARITAPDMIVIMRADRRYDALRTAAPERLDVDAAVATRIALLEQQAAAAPDLLEPRLRLAEVLISANRCKDSLALADEVLARTGGPTAETKPYTDTGTLLVWILNARSRALACVGRSDEAVHQLEQAAILQEGGAQNTSQAINLAGLYVRVGRPADALTMLKRVGGTSPYGKMEVESVRLKAAAKLGDRATVETALSYMREHRNDALRTLQDGLLVAGARDEAAELMVQRLTDPAGRGAALLDLQIFGNGSAPPSDEPHESLGSLRTDRRVAAAVSRFGRIESYPNLRP